MAKNYQRLQRQKPSNVRSTPLHLFFFFLEPWLFESWLIWKPHTPSFILSDLWDCWEPCCFSACWCPASPKFLNIHLRFQKEKSGFQNVGLTSVGFPSLWYLDPSTPGCLGSSLKISNTSILIVSIFFSFLLTTLLYLEMVVLSLFLFTTA